jgi:hypothetical protein
VRGANVLQGFFDPDPEREHRQRIDERWVDILKRTDNSLTTTTINARDEDLDPDDDR